MSWGLSARGRAPPTRARHPNVSLKEPSFGASLRLLPPLPARAAVVKLLREAYADF